MSIGGHKTLLCHWLQVTYLEEHWCLSLQDASTIRSV